MKKDYNFGYKNPYGRFFLAEEDESQSIDPNLPTEELDENKPKEKDNQVSEFPKNMKVIDIKPRKYNRYDFKDEEDDIIPNTVDTSVNNEQPVVNPSEQLPVDTSMDPQQPVPTEPQPMDNNQSLPIEEPVNPDIPMEQNQPVVDPSEQLPVDPSMDPQQPVPTEPQPMDSEIPSEVNVNDMSLPTEDPNSMPVVDDTMGLDDNSSYVDVSGDNVSPTINTDDENFDIPEDEDDIIPPEDMGGELPPEDPNVMPPDGGTVNDAPVPNGPGLEYNSTRKYLLFKNFISLSNAIDNYISKLEIKMGNDTEETILYKNATSKLREINELCYDYMTMKYEISSYVQSLLFFQNLVVMVQMVFDLINKTGKKIKNNNNEKKH